MCFVHWNTFILKPTGFQELLSFINKGFFFILFSAGFSKNRRQNTYRVFSEIYLFNICESVFFCIRQTRLNFWKFHFLSLSQKNRCIFHFFDKIKVLRVGLKIGHAILQGGRKQKLWISKIRRSSRFWVKFRTVHHLKLRLQSFLTHKSHSSDEFFVYHGSLTLTEQKSKTRVF